MFECKDAEKILGFLNQDVIRYRHIIHDLASPLPKWDNAMQRYGFVEGKGDEITGILTTINNFTDKCSEISAVFVDPEHRRKGYASSLLSIATKDILNNGKTPTYFAGGYPAHLIKMLEGAGYFLNSYFWEWRYWW